VFTRKTSTAGKCAAAVATLGLVATGFAGQAQADTLNDHYPETPKTNVDLPIVNTYHGSDHIKANILNPRPVCNSGEDFRTVVYKVKDNFPPAGTISATNGTADTIPLTQDLSKSQSIQLSVKGDRTSTTTANLGGWRQRGQGQRLHRHHLLPGQDPGLRSLLLPELGGRPEHRAIRRASR